MLNTSSNSADGTHVIGANIMSPGLTSAGGQMDEVPESSVVGVFAEGKVRQDELFMLAKIMKA